MLDLHIIHAVSNGVKHYQTDINAFKQIFKDVSDSYAQKLFTKFATLDINFDNAYSRTHETYPLITASLAEKTSDEDQTLGNFAFNGEKGLFLRQESIISVYSNDFDTLRILHRVIQASMLLHKDSFLGSGYLNIEFVSSIELEPDEEVIGDGVIVYQRKLTYNALRHLTVTPHPNTENTFTTWTLSPEVVE